MTLTPRNSMILFGLTNNMLLVKSVDSLEREREREREREKKNCKCLIITNAVLHRYNLNYMHLWLKGIFDSF